MCAIVGFICPNPTPEAIDTLKRLFWESKIRGMHAYGFAATENGETRTLKTLKISELLNNIGSPQALIGHCRYSTSGDYTVMENNQPLEFEGEHMAFNGVIDMRTKPEMEQAYGIKMNSDNDGEIMLQCPDRMALLKTKISFAGLFLNGTMVSFIRNNNRPAYVAEKHGAVYIASTADILRRCLLRGEPLQPLKVYSWTA